jgi:3-phenylpropionate/trans-cinnamate dioxygenase ferredoxin reductase subunit
MSEHLIIVGAGQAAAQAVQTLTQHDYPGTITIVGEEPYLPYQRPPLSKKYLARELVRDRLSIRPATFYAERSVTMRLGQRVASLDPLARHLELESGETLGYDRLLLATGSRVRTLDVPGATLDGVCSLRGIDDADRIGAELEPGRRLVVIGAGYIGLEVAAIARARGLDVTVLEAADRAMARVVSPEVSRFYEAVHSQAGVGFHFGSVVEAITGRHRVEAVVTAGGHAHACDCVVVGIGIEPAIELAEHAGLTCDDGIAVDAQARTSNADVFAAGDCTSHPNAIYDRRVRLESVHNAIEQSKAAALSLLGRPENYAQVPWFWSDQYDLKLQIAGLSQGHDTVAMRGDQRERRFAAYYLRNGRLIAVDAINSPKDFVLGKRLIAARAEIDPTHISDENVDLEAAVRTAEQTRRMP